MIKKMTAGLTAWWWKKIVGPLLLKHPVHLTSATYKLTMSQMRRGGMSFEQINKWLRITGQKPIVEYCYPNGPKREPIVTTVPFTPEERRQLGVQIYLVS